MNPLRAAALGLSLLIFCPAWATTLLVPNELELLVVDGKPLGGSLLRGAGSIELARGDHQLVFSLNKPVYEASGGAVDTQTPYIIGLFNTRDARTLALRLPLISGRADATRFRQRPDIALLDEQGNPIEVNFAWLAATSNGGLTDALKRYNQTHGLTGHLENAGSPPVPARATSLSQAEQMLRFWFLQADGTSRRHFLRWAEQRQGDWVADSP